MKNALKLGALIALVMYGKYIGDRLLVSLFATAPASTGSATQA